MPAVAEPAVISKKNQDVKVALIQEIDNLEKALSNAQGKVYDLFKDKEIIENDLKNMQAWGLQQQADKLQYYKELVFARGELAGAKQKYDDEKALHDKTKNKYHKLKTILGAAVGVLFLLLYFRFGSPMVTQTAKLTGAWSPLVEITAPLFMFGLGFLLVFLIF